MYGWISSDICASVKPLPQLRSVVCLSPSNVSCPCRNPIATLYDMLVFSQPLSSLSLKVSLRFLRLLKRPHGDTAGGRPLSTKEQGLPRNRPPSTWALRLAASSTVRKRVSAVSAPQSAACARAAPADSEPVQTLGSDCLGYVLAGVC